MSWKDPPFAVAVTLVVGTATVMFTVVMPIWDKLKDNEIADLKTEPTKLKSELDGLSGQLRRMESENLKLRRDLDRLSPDSLFSLDDVYPRGFRAIRIGDRLELLSKVYGSEADLEDEGNWITVKFRKPKLFTQIAYYYDEGAKPRTVTHILFHFDNKDGRTFEFLKQELIDKYSEAKMKKVKGFMPKTTALAWSGIHNQDVQLGDGTLSIDRSE